MGPKTPIPIIKAPLVNELASLPEDRGRQRGRGIPFRLHVLEDMVIL